MKKITMLLMVCIGFISCETLEVTNDENEYVFNTNLEDLLKEIQLNFPQFIEKSGKMGSRLTRIDYLFGEQYIDIYDSGLYQTNNADAWDLAYSNLLPAMIEAEEIALEEGAYNHLGVIKTLKAFTLLTLVDLYGDVPYSEILLPNPNLDTGDSIYNSIILLLDEALVDFSVQGSVLDIDFYYNNDFPKWIRLVNTLKMKVYLNTRLVDNNAISSFEAIVNTGDFITSIEDDFEFRYFNSEMIHPDYEKDYNDSGAGRYRSNWLMNKMVQLNDPRIRFYFYRQTDCTPGNIGANGEFCEPFEPSLGCSILEAPSHFPEGMTFCSVPKGYWGRDHGYSEGIPPDSFLRSTIGVYPAAGKFDGDSFEPIGSNIGGQGLGITPILLSSWVEFMRAEIALVSNDISTANSSMQNAIQSSIDKVLGFATLDPNADLDFVPTSLEISNFLIAVGDDFNVGDSQEKWNILAEQQFISSYGNGNNSYSFYRRTGFPTTLQFHLNENAGPFVRSILYPQNIVNENSNIDQKPNAEVRVFWDNNPAYPTFPIAN